MCAYPQKKEEYIAEKLGPDGDDKKQMAGKRSIPFLPCCTEHEIVSRDKWSNCQHRVVVGCSFLRVMFADCFVASLLYPLVAMLF